MEPRSCFKLFGVPIFPDRQSTPPILIFRKRLFESDVSGNLTRLTMPYNQLVVNKFLNDQEERLLHQKDEKNKPQKIPVQVIDPRDKSHNLTLSRWDYNKPPSSKLELKLKPSVCGKRKRKSDPSWSYALCGGWKQLVKSSGLCKGDRIEVWAYRRADNDGGLGFLIKKVEMEPAINAPRVLDGDSCNKKMRLMGLQEPGFSLHI